MNLELAFVFAAQRSAFAAFKSLPACGSIYFPLYRRAGFIAYDSVKCMPMLSAPMQNMLSAGCALWSFDPPVSLFRNSLIQSDLFGMGKNHFKYPFPAREWRRGDRADNRGKRHKKGTRRNAWFLSTIQSLSINSCCGSRRSSQPCRV